MREWWHLSQIVYDSPKGSFGQMDEIQKLVGYKTKNWCPKKELNQLCWGKLS